MSLPEQIICYVTVTSLNIIATIMQPDSPLYRSQNMLHWPIMRFFFLIQQDSALTQNPHTASR